MLAVDQSAGSARDVLLLRVVRLSGCLSHACRMLKAGRRDLDYPTKASWRGACAQLSRESCCRKHHSPAPLAPTSNTLHTRLEPAHLSGLDWTGLSGYLYISTHLTLSKATTLTGLRTAGLGLTATHLTGFGLFWTSGVSRQQQSTSTAEQQQSSSILIQ
jgi:hypothetical protein